MLKSLYVPTPPKRRHTTLTSLPAWDAQDPTVPRIPNDTLRDAVPIWGFVLFMFAAFIAFVWLFGYVWT